MSSSQQYPAGVPGAPPGGATTLSSVAKSTDLTAATRSMRRQQKRKGKTHLGGHVLHGCAGAPRRGIARGHLGDGGHDADAPDLPAQRRQLPAALLRAVYKGREMKLTCRAAAASSQGTTTRTAESAWSAPNRRPERA